MSPNRRRTSGQRASPKVFVCSGYGDCKMEFTRSEHLQRHIRKHTGEKPYPCIVENCDRRFSRFDNMMQHTQTHYRSRRGSTANRKNAKSKREESPEDDMPFTRPPPPPPLSLSMVTSRVLPCPLNMPSSSSSLQEHRYSWPMYPPSASSSSYDESYPPWSRRSSVSTITSSDSSFYSPTSSVEPHREPEIRRMSVVDLGMPLERFSELRREESPDQGKTIDLTSDEYEALQGFSKIRSGDSRRSLSVESSPKPDYGISNCASQVSALRQRAMTNESYERR